MTKLKPIPARDLAKALDLTKRQFGKALAELAAEVPAPTQPKARKRKVSIVSGAYEWFGYFYESAQGTRFLVATPKRSDALAARQSEEGWDAKTEKIQRVRITLPAPAGRGKK